MKKDSKPFVSVVIPAYNEGLELGETIRSVMRVLDDIGSPYEIIVVDDGSTDQTGETARQSGAKVVTNPYNRGKGYALRKGFEKASGDIIVTIDADLAYDPQEIPALIKPLMAGIDIVGGSRFLGNSNVRPYAMSRIVRLMNYLFNLSLFLMTGKRVTDSQTGFKAIRKQTLEKLNLTSMGFEIESEITAKGVRDGFKFEEVPVTMRPRYFILSKFKEFRDGYRILSTIIRTSLEPTDIGGE